MGQHYFTVGKEGHFYVARIHVKPPGEGKSFEMGRVHQNCINGPAQLGAWSDMMSDMSDYFVQGAFKNAGQDLGPITTQDLRRTVPKAN